MKAKISLMKNVSNKQLARLRSLGYSAAKDCSAAGTVIKYLKEILQTVTIQSQHASALLLKCRFQHRCLQIYKSWTCSRGHYQRGPENLVPTTGSNLKLRPFLPLLLCAKKASFTSRVCAS